MQYREVIKNIKPYIPGVLKPGAIKLASNENPLGPSPLAIKAIKDIECEVSLYPDGGCVELKQALAVKYKLNTDNFVIGNGSDEIFLFITGALINSGDEMVTSECTFSEYNFASMLYGGKTVYSKLTNGRYDIESMLINIKQSTKLVFIANPNNPTGTYITQRELDSLMQKVNPDTLVVMDEAYYEYVTAQDYPDTVAMLKKYKNLLITRTFSKIYGLAGLRVGYAIGDADLIQNLNKTREPFNVNSLAQKAAIAALGDTDFVKKSRDVNEIGKKYLYEEFNKLGLKYFPTEANFIYVEIPLDCIEAFQKLMDLGVTIRPMKSFGQDKAIRVTIGTPAQNAKFIDCLKKILNA